MEKTGLAPNRIVKKNKRKKIPVPDKLWSQKGPCVDLQPEYPYSGWARKPHTCIWFEAYLPVIAPGAWQKQ